MMRNQIHLATLCAAAALAMLASATRVFADVPPAPAGYSSETAIKAAFFAGMLKTIDVNLPVPDSIKVEKGIEYGKGGDVSLKLDLYQPVGGDGPGDPLRPAIIFVHGGAWKGGNREIYHYLSLIHI